MFNENRTHHRPVSITVETISKLPTVRELPPDIEMTVNLKLNKEKTKELIDFLTAEYEALYHPDDLVIATITGIAK